MWIIVSLHNNDFSLDMSLLGEFVIRIMDFFSTTKKVYVEYNPLLKAALRDMLFSIYKFHLLLDEEFDMEEYKLAEDRFENLTICMTDNELNEALSRICDRRSIKEIHHIDELAMCDGNYEYLIIHCCDYETKCIVV